MTAARRLRRDPDVAEPTPLTVQVAAARENVTTALESLVRTLLEDGLAAPRYYTQKTSPLGRRRHRELARAGAFKAWKLGNDWYALTEAVHAYIETHGRPRPDESAVRLGRRIR